MCVERVINFYEELYPGDAQLHLVLTVLNDYLDEKIKFKELRRVILETYKIARETKNLPAQFALRAATLAPPLCTQKNTILGQHCMPLRQYSMQDREIFKNLKRNENGN